MNNGEEQISCDSLTGDILSDYLDGTMNANFRAKMMAHIIMCPSCNDRMEEIKRIRMSIKHNRMLNDDIPIPKPAPL